MRTTKILALVGSIALMAFATAQAEVTFGASVTNANGSLSTTLTWNAPGASGCTASGHPSWTGAKAASGTQALPAITLSGTYTLSLACSFPGDTRGVVTWVNPTANTDGTAYSNPKHTRVCHGASATAITSCVNVLTPGTTHTFTGLPVGARFFAAYAVNQNDVSSAISNVATKTLTAGSSENGSVTLTVNPIPGAPSGVTIQ